MSPRRVEHLVTAGPVTVNADRGYGERTYQARCSCGWEGLYKDKRGPAEIEGAVHAVGHPIERKPQAKRGRRT